jgi:hypothetical protein
MKISRNRLKKCCQPTQTGIPRCPLGSATVPGYWSMNVATAGRARSSLASAMPTINPTKPIGSSHSRLNHRDRPRRTRGAIPDTAGTDPAHVATSMASSPWVSCGRPCGAAGGRSDGSACPTPTGGSSVASPGRCWLSGSTGGWRQPTTGGCCGCPGIIASEGRDRGGAAAWAPARCSPAVPSRRGAQVGGTVVGRRADRSSGLCHFQWLAQGCGGEPHVGGGEQDRAGRLACTQCAETIVALAGQYHQDRGVLVLEAVW